MTSYDIQSFSELTAALIDAGARGTDANITLNFIGNFSDTPVLIDIPANVRTCTINGDTVESPAPVYNTRIETTRSDYLELTLNNLNLRISDDNPVIDIAKDGVSTTGTDVIYNKLILSGNNLIENNYTLEDPSYNTCGIHIGASTGLNIEVLSDSVTTVNTIIQNASENNNSISAAIGGRIEENGGSIMLIVDGTLNSNCIFNSNVSAICATGSGIGGGSGSFMRNGGNGGNIDISGSGTVNSSSECTGDPICATGAGIGGGGSFMKAGGSGGAIRIFGDVNVVSVSKNDCTEFSSIGAGIGGGGSSNNNAGSGGSITITDSSSVIANCINNNGVASSLGAGLGGGGSISAVGGTGGSITISGEAVVTSSSTNNETVLSAVGAGIGGGGSHEDSTAAGSGGIINISGTAKVTANSYSVYDSVQGDSGLGAGIGGGGSVNGIPGDGGTINIFETSEVISSSNGSSAAGIGGGCKSSTASTSECGNSGTIRIYDSAKVNSTAQGYGAGIGGAGFGVNTIVSIADTEVSINAITNGNADIAISDSAEVSASSELGFGIGIGTDSSGELTSTGNVDISTIGDITVPKNDAENFAIGGGSNCNVSLTNYGVKDILGGISGNALTITDNKLVLDKLVYNNLTFDNGFIVVNDAAHEEIPNDRGDYEILNLTENNIPYSEPVLLKDITGAVEGTIQASDAGKVNVYLSSGEYYLTESVDEYYKTDILTVTPDTPHDPEADLPLSSEKAKFTGTVHWSNSKEGTDGMQSGIIVTLYDSKRNRTNFGSVTDADGKYVIYGVDPGTYYEGFSNRPSSFVFVEDDAIDNSGITKNSYTVAAEDEEVIHAELAFNEGTLGKRGEPGRPGLDGHNFPSSSINMFRFEPQIIPQNSEVNLGNVVEGNGNSIFYSPTDNSIVLNKVGTFNVRFDTNAAFINDHSNDDYLALQLKLGNDFVQPGFTYLRERGILFSSTLVNVTDLNNNRIKLINVGSQDMRIANFGITILNIS